MPIWMIAVCVFAGIDIVSGVVLWYLIRDAPHEPYPGAWG